MKPIELRFTVVVTNDDDGGYVAECEELGLFTCADTLDELRVMAEHLISGHLQARAKQGTLLELIGELDSDVHVSNPIPPMELVTDFKLRQSHSFRPQ